MRVVSRKGLKDFWELPGREDAKGPLSAWYHRTKAAKWNGPQDVKAEYGSASILKSGRVVFNIGGRKYRLVVKIIYESQMVYIRFVGTHAQYDQIDAEEI